MIDATLNFIDREDKKYVVHLDEALLEKHRPFFETVPYEEGSTVNATIRLPDSDPPAAVAAVIQVLQHGAFTVPPDAAPLAFLADALLVAARHRLDAMAVQALQLFDDHLNNKFLPSSSSLSGGNDAEVAFAAHDFVAAVQAAYAPDPDAVEKQWYSKALQGERLVLRERVSELKRLVVEFAAEGYEDMMEDEAYAALFVDKEYPFYEEVRKAAKMKQGRGGWDDDGTDGDDGDDGDDDALEQKVAVGVIDWDFFFGDERFVTIIDRKGKAYVTTRKAFHEGSRFLELAPRPEPGSTFGHAIYKLPDDHPSGVEAVHRMLEDGIRYFGVPRRIEHAADAAIDWLTHGLRVGYAYGVVEMVWGVALVLANEPFLDRCSKPHAIAEAVRIVYAFDQDRLCERELNQLRDCLVAHFAARSDGVLRKEVYRDLFEQVPEFGDTVRKEKLKKMGRADEDADNDDDDGGADSGVEFDET